jgi:hypothetical protein
MKRHYVESDVVTSIVAVGKKYQLRVNLGASILSELSEDDLDHMIGCLQKLRNNQIDFYQFPRTATALKSLKQSESIAKITDDC